MKKLIFFFGLLIILFSSCQKELSIDDGTVIPVDTVAGQAYYQATIDGVDYEVIVTGNSTNQFISLINGEEEADLISGVINPLPQGTGLLLVKGIFPDFPNATNASLKAFFAPGDYSLMSNNLQVLIVWIDENGTEWVSVTEDNQDQTGSKFTIVSVRDAPDSNGKYYVEVVAKFNCNLYDADGNKKVLTKGNYKGFFGPIE